MGRGHMKYAWQYHTAVRSMTMKKSGHTGADGHPGSPATAAAARRTPVKKNGHASAKRYTNGHANGNGKTTAPPPNLHILLHGLQAMRDGDFSVRLPGNWTGLEGKIADTFNEIVAANQQMAQELQRVGQVVGKEGKTRERTRFAQSKGAWGEMEVSVNTLVEDLLR